MQRHEALFARDAAGAIERGAPDRLDEPLWPSGPNARKLAELCVLTTLAPFASVADRLVAVTPPTSCEVDAGSPCAPFERRR